MAQGASLFRLLNIVTAVLIVLGGILLFVHNGSWNSSILGVFIVLFGLLTFALEFAIPETLVYNLGFMFSLLGRGFFYVSMGLLTLAWQWFNIVVGCFIMVIGFFYIAMHFVGATPSPSMSAVPNTSTTNLNAGSSEPKSYTNPSEHVDDLQPQMSQPQMTQSGSYQNPSTGSYQNPSTGSYQTPSTGPYQTPGTGSYQTPGTSTYPNQSTSAYDASHA